MTVLDINGLMVFYENAIAINNVNLSCQESKITGIFGANSAGKSTLMYAISGIILDLKKKGTDARRRAYHHPGEHLL